MAITQEYVSQLEPKFSDVESDDANLLIAIASLQVGPRWGDLADYATALLVLHQWTINSRGGRGMVTQERIGDVERSYASSQADPKDPLHLTNWGLEYKRIAATIRTGPSVI